MRNAELDEAHAGIKIARRNINNFRFTDDTTLRVVGFSCFFYDPMDVGNLISGSFAFSKSSLTVYKFTVQVLLKPGLENFEHYFACL